MQKGYAVLYKDMKFDYNVGVTKEDILTSVNDHLDSFAEEELNPVKSDIYVFDRLKDAKKYANDPSSEKEENEGFAILRVQYSDDVPVELDATVEGTNLKATLVDFSELTFTSAYVKHFHPAFEKLGRININETGANLLKAYEASKLVLPPALEIAPSEEEQDILHDNNDVYPDLIPVVDLTKEKEIDLEPAEEVEPEPEVQKPSRLKGIFSLRNLAIAGAVALTGAALLTPMGMAAAISATSFVAKSAAGVYFGITAAVLAGSIGLGLIARRFLKRTSSTNTETDNNELDTNEKLNSELMTELKEKLNATAANDDISKDALGDNVTPLTPAAKHEANKKSCCSSSSSHASELDAENVTKVKNK